MDHAFLFIKYLQNNNYEVTLGAIAKPEHPYKSFREPLVEALKHEEFVTASIHSIYAEAVKTNDYRTMEFLNWFIKEQGEEEKNASELIVSFDMHGVPGLFALDGRLHSRAYHAPSLSLD